MNLKTTIAVLAVLCIACAVPAMAEPIRVGLFSGPDAPRSVTVAGDGRWEARRADGRFSGVCTVSRIGDELQLANAGQPPAKIGPWVNFWPARDSNLALNSSHYRGWLKVEVQKSGGLRVVNTLDIEEYLQGTVPNEIFTVPSALGALEVQAVVSRTLARFIERTQPRHAGEGFTVCSGVHCQVYRGLGSENALANQAIQHTRGEVLTYNGQVILAAYHANAGGLTAPTDEAWPGSLRVAYLTPVASPYDDFASALRYSDCYQWREVVRSTQIRDRVRRLIGVDVGTVSDVVLSRSESGRIGDVKVIGAHREIRIRKPQEFRVVLGLVGETTGKSYDHDTRMVSIRKIDGGFVLKGYGAGEGVGLSQHGAIGMARAGFTCTEILAHYYRGVDLTEGYGAGKTIKLRRPDLRPRIQATNAAAERG